MGIIESAKEVVKIVQQIDNIELNRKVLDLEAEVLELTQQLREKDETISKLNEALETKGKIICQNSVYFMVDDEGNKKDGPFCTKCFDVDHFLCRLIQFHPGGDGRSWEWIQYQRCKLPFRSPKAAEYIGQH
jgi:hypothetical protein